MGVVDGLPSGKKEIKLEVDSGVWKRIEEQVKFLREMNIPEMKIIQKPEDLVVFYIEQLSLSDQQFSDNRRRVLEALEGFSDRGVNMRQLLNNFTCQSISSDHEDEGEEWDN